MGRPVLSTPPLLTFTVHGHPAAQGSKVRTQHGGMRESSRKLAPWRTAVADTTARAMNGQPLFDCPLWVRCTFVFPRPKGHYGTGRNARMLKASAPEHYAQQPDVDKLLRAVLDGMTGQAIHSDAQVVGVSARKTWGEPAGALVEVWAL